MQGGPRPAVRVPPHHGLVDGVRDACLAVEIAAAAAVGAGASATKPKRRKSRTLPFLERLEGRGRVARPEAETGGLRMVTGGGCGVEQRRRPAEHWRQVSGKVRSAKSTADKGEGFNTLLLPYI